jgi:hypothetical protein
MKFFACNQLIVTLADVLIRKLMKTKSMEVESQADPDWENLLVQAEVLKIEKCETKWDKLNQNKFGHQLPFDPLCLQEELTRRLRQLVDESEVQQIEDEILENMFV